MRMLSVVFLLSLLGCASQPQSTEVKQAAPSAQPPQSVPAPTAAAAPTAVAKADANPAKFKIPSGYTQRKGDGEPLYCRKDAVLGSRFPKEQCFNLAELQQYEIRNEAMREEIKQKQRMQTPPPSR